VRRLFVPLALLGLLLLPSVPQASCVLSDITGMVAQLPQAERMPAILESLARCGAIPETDVVRFQRIFSQCPIADEVLLRAVRQGEEVGRIASALSKGETYVVGKSIVLNARIVDRYAGIAVRHVDLLPTLEKITAGDLPAHSNQGWKIFANLGTPLPARPRNYYREYRHPTEGISGAGPQRIVTGKNGEIYYTPDHYTSFHLIERGADLP